MEELQQDLLENYTIDDITLLAKYHNISINNSIYLVVKNIANVNHNRLYKAHFLNATILHETPIYISMVVNLSFDDMNNLCRTDNRFGEICRTDNGIWAAWARAHIGKELNNAFIKMVKNNNKRLVKIFLVNGADVNVIIGLNTPLRIAESLNDEELEQLLLDAGAKRLTKPRLLQICKDKGIKISTRMNMIQLIKKCGDNL